MKKTAIDKTVTLTSEDPQTPTDEFEASLDFYPAFDIKYEEVNEIVDKLRNALVSERNPTYYSESYYVPIVRAFIRPFVHKLCRKASPHLHNLVDPDYHDSPMALGSEMQAFISIFPKYDYLETDVGRFTPYGWEIGNGLYPRYVIHSDYNQKMRTQSEHYVLELKGSCLRSGPGFVFRLLEAEFDMPLLAIVRGGGRYYGVYKAVPNIVKRANRFLGKMGISAPSELNYLIKIPVPGSGDARLAFLKTAVDM